MSPSDDSPSQPPKSGDDAPESPPSPDDVEAGTAKTVQMTSLPPELQRQYGVGDGGASYPDPSLSTRPPTGQGGQAMPPQPAPPPAPAQPGWAAQGPPPQPASGQAPPSSPAPPGPPPQAPPPSGQGVPPPGPYGATSAGPGPAQKLQTATRDFFRIDLRRALRLRLDADDVLPAERQALRQASPPVTDPNVQSFLAWRKSLLMVAAVVLVPVALLSGIETFANLSEGGGAVNGLFILQWLVTVVFTVACWVLLRSWTAWSRQRKKLFWFWLVFFLAPFVVFLFPFRSLLGAMTAQQALLVGMVFSIVAVLTLAPKALSLMPGLIRASIIAKVLFPGAAAPGWLMALSGPIDALIVYVILLTPYQMTGNGFFVPAMIGLIGAPLFVAKAGYELARPMTPEEALSLVTRARKGYYALTIVGLFFLFIAVIDLVLELEIGFLSALNLILALIVNVLLLGLVGTDMLLVALDRAQGISDDPSSERLRKQYDARLERFLAETPGTRLSQVMRPVTGPPPGSTSPPPHPPTPPESKGPA